MSTPARPATRRERVRAATVEEIKQTARVLLVRDGAAGLSLRAIGREMGMTAAALYRYFPSLDALVDAVCGDLYDDARVYLEQARDALPAADPGDRIFAVCRAFRRWSLAHRTEFSIMFGTPLPLLAGASAGAVAAATHLDPRHKNSPAHQAGGRFAEVFSTLFADLWSRQPFPVPEPSDIAPALFGQLQAYVAEIGAPLPAGAAQVFLSCWIRLYGMVALEVYGHLHFALTDIEPMFEAELALGLRQLGLAPR